MKIVDRVKAMNSYRKIVSRLIFLSFLCLFSTACDVGLYPIDVSEGFWRAVKDKDVKAIKKYSIESSLKRSDPGENILALDEITLGRTVIDGDNAWVDTTVTISGDRPYTIPLKTVLIRENKRWKVDYDATMKHVSQESAVASIINNIRNMSKDLAEEINQSMEEIQKSIPEVKEEVEKIEKSLLESIPELKIKIEALVRELKDSIEELGKKPEEPTATET